MKTLFDKVILNHITLKNRLVRSATWEAVAAQDGSIGNTAYEIYREASLLLGSVQKRPVRLIGVGIYHLSTEYVRQLSFDDYLEDKAQADTAALQAKLEALQQRYHLDFAGHLDQIYRGEILHKTAEYMRRHIQ